MSQFFYGAAAFWVLQMIYIQLNASAFEYDIYNLIRSFYPRAKVRFLYPEDVAKTVDGGQTACDALQKRQWKKDRARRHQEKWKKTIEELNAEKASFSGNAGQTGYAEPYAVDFSKKNNRKNQRGNRAPSFCGQNGR